MNDVAWFRPVRLCAALASAALMLAACGDGDSLGSDGAQTGGTDGGATSGFNPSSGTQSSTATTMGSTAGTTEGTSGGDTGGEDDNGEAESGGESGSSSSSTGDACDDQTPVELFISPDDSNSMSSPVQVRASVLDDFSSVHSVPIRTWEFMNYYGFDYPAADEGSVVVTPQLHRDEDDPEGQYELQIAVSSEQLADNQRAPINITLVLDESGSMGGHPMEMLKESCRAIAGSLREGDVVSMVTWDTSNAEILAGHQVSGPNDPMLMAAISDMEAGGGTDLHGGLTAGYALAQQHYRNDRINRIVLISDGGANAGVIDVNIISEHSGGQNEDGIYMVGVGVGTLSTYNDELMDEVTDAGKGASVFVAAPSDATRFFSTDFVNTLAVAARDVQVKLDMPPGFEIVKFSGEEFSANPEEIEPQHLAPNDAMVFYQRVETCAADGVTDDSEITVTARYRDAITFEEREQTVTMTFADLLAADNAQLLKGAAIFQYAESLKAYRMGGADPLAPAFAALDEADAALPGDADLAEIRTILESL